MVYEPLHNFGICFLNAAQITAETVLIQLFAGGAIPQAAGIRADLIGQNDTAISGLAELQLKVHQCHATLGPKSL